MLRPLAACCEAFGAACNWMGEHVLWPLCDALGTAVGAIGSAVGRVVGREATRTRRPQPCHDDPHLTLQTP